MGLYGCGVGVIERVREPVKVYGKDKKTVTVRKTAVCQIIIIAKFI